MVLSSPASLLLFFRIAIVIDGSYALHDMSIGALHFGHVEGRPWLPMLLIAMPEDIMATVSCCLLHIQLKFLLLLLCEAKYFAHSMK